MTSCITGGGEGVEKICECMINKLQDQYTLEEFQKIEADLEAGQGLPEEVDEIASSCQGDA